MSPEICHFGPLQFLIKETENMGAIEPCCCKVLHPWKKIEPGGWELLALLGHLDSVSTEHGGDTALWSSQWIKYVKNIFIFSKPSGWNGPRTDSSKDPEHQIMKRPGPHISSVSDVQPNVEFCESLGCCFYLMFMRVTLLTFPSFSSPHSYSVVKNYHLILNLHCTLCILFAASIVFFHRGRNTFLGRQEARTAPEVEPQGWHPSKQFPRLTPHVRYIDLPRAPSLTAPSSWRANNFHLRKRRKC